MDKMFISNQIIDPINNTSTVIDPNLLPDYSQNALFYPNGDLALYAADGRIYDANNNLVASFINEDTCYASRKKKKMGLGYSEFIFVKVPNTCNEFYAITSHGTRNFEHWMGFKNNWNIGTGFIVYKRLKFLGSKWIELITEPYSYPYLPYKSGQHCTQGTVLFACLNSPSPSETRMCVEDFFNNTSEGLAIDDTYAPPKVDDPSEIVRFNDPDNYTVPHSSSLIEVTKEQSNGKRYLFAAFPRCFLNVFEIDSNDIHLVNNFQSNFGNVILNPNSPAITQNIDTFGNFENYQFNRGEMELFQNNDIITIAFPFVNTKTRNKIIVTRRPSYTGIQFFEIQLVNGAPSIPNKIYVSLLYEDSTIITNDGVNEKVSYGMVKGIEFSPSGEYLYATLSNIYDETNSIFNFKNTITILKKQPIPNQSGQYFLKDQTWFPYPSNATYNASVDSCDIKSNFGAINTNPLIINHQLALSQLEKDKNNNLIISRQDALLSLSNMDTPNFNNLTVLPISNFRNRITQYDRNWLCNSTEIFDGTNKLKNISRTMMNFTFLLPDQIDNEPYNTWISPIADLYPPFHINLPGAIYPSFGNTDIPHKIYFYAGTNSSQEDTVFHSSQDFTLSWPNTLDYERWDQYVPPQSGNPITKAIVKHTASIGKFCAGEEEIEIFDITNSKFVDLSFTLIPSPPPIIPGITCFSTLYLTPGNNIYKIPNYIFNCTIQRFFVYDYNGGSRGGLVAFKNNQIYSSQPYPVCLNRGIYEVVYEHEYNGCLGAFSPTTINSSKIIIVP